MGKINELDVSMDTPAEPGFYPLKGVNPKIVSNPNLTHWEPFPADPNQTTKKQQTVIAHQTKKPAKGTGPYPDDEFRKKQVKETLQKYVLDEEDDHVRHVTPFRIARGGKPDEDESFVMTRDEVHPSMVEKVGVDPAELIHIQDELEKLLPTYLSKLKGASNRYTASFVLFPIFPVSMPLKLHSDAMFDASIPRLLKVVTAMRNYLATIPLAKESGAYLECGLSQKHFEASFRQPQEQMYGVGHHFYYQMIEVQLVVPESLVDGYIAPVSATLSSSSNAMVLQEEEKVESLQADEPTAQTGGEEKRQDDDDDDAVVGISALLTEYEEKMTERSEEEHSNKEAEREEKVEETA